VLRELADILADPGSQAIMSCTSFLACATVRFAQPMSLGGLKLETKRASG
jgi:hypothetical protein